MKIYDKRIFKTTEKMKVVALVMILFVFGFWIGYFVSNLEVQKMIEEKEKTIQEQYTELESLRETVYMYKTYGK